MRKHGLRVAAASLALALGLGLAAPSLAGEPAPSTWYDSWKRTDSDRLLDRQEAEMLLRARGQGYGPAVVTSHYYGDLSSYSTYNGPVTNSGATNIVNSNSTATSVSGSSGVNITVTTGQNSNSANQNASSSIAVGAVNH